ncbi:MAG: prolyl oligopeptidase family serine peptidase, partial [Gammaproteobacteria bacterium]
MLKKQSPLSLLLLLLCLSPIKASELPIEAYSALPVMSMVRISPEGNRIAYRAVRSEEDYLVIKDIASDKIVGGLMLGDINPSHAYFVDQDRVIMIGSTHKKIMGFRGKHDVSSAFIYDVNTNKVEQLLVPGRKIYTGQSGLGRVVGFSQDLSYAYMPAFTGDTSATPRYSLMKVDLSKPRRITREERGRHDTQDYFLNAQAQVIARERYNNENNLHTIDALVDGDWVEVYRENTEIMTKSFVGLTPDYQSLVMLGSADGNQNAYFTLSLKDGSISDPIFYREDASIERVLMSKQRVVYGVKYSGFRPDYAFFSKRLTATYKAIQQALPNNTFKIIDHTPDWKTILFYMEGDQSSGDYLLFSGGEFNYVASARPAVVAEAVANVREYAFQARDGLTIPTLLTYPLGKESSKEPLPAILMPHGGPQSHDKIGYYWLSQYFANRGYLVIQPQFRGSSGFGYKFTREGYGEWGKKMQDDLTD